MKKLPSFAAADEPLNRAVARQAAQWMVRLMEQPVDPADEAACRLWRTHSPAHEHAWQTALAVMGKLDSLPHGPAHTALKRSVRSDRRAVLKSLALLLTTLPAGYLSYRYLPWREWNAEFRTGTGEQVIRLLTDGSTVVLNTATSLDVRFDAQRRLLVLHEGEILVQTASHGGDTPRPFSVKTPQGDVTALGTRFIVSTLGRTPEGHAASVVTVLQHAVRIEPTHAVASNSVVAAGMQVSFTADRISSPRAANRYADAWTSGMLVVDGMRLDVFLAELGRYRHGLLRCDPAIAGLRISGSFQLGNIDGILKALPDTLPVSVLQRTRYWVTVVPA